MAEAWPERFVVVSIVLRSQNSSTLATIHICISDTCASFSPVIFTNVTAAGRNASPTEWVRSAVHRSVIVAAALSLY